MNKIIIVIYKFINLSAYEMSDNGINKTIYLRS